MMASAGHCAFPVGAVLVPFPLVRRRALIERTAEQMLARPLELAEKHLAMQVRRQASAMRRKQIAEDVISRQVASFEAAVRGELWRLVLAPDQPSGAA
jgi:hypothetical protein